MLNPYQLKTAKIIKITDQAPGVKLFEFEFMGERFKLGKKFSHEPGQFLILSLPGFGEAPFAPCNKIGKNLELCVRAAGRLTNHVHALRPGDKVGIRGPFGSGWPANELKDKNLLIVVGGLGLVPLRSLIFEKEKYLGKDSQVQIFYGAKNPDEFIFKNDLQDWRKGGIDVQMTIDKECTGWNECIGVVTVLFEKRNIVPDPIVFLCGPPVMYKFCLEKVKANQIKDEKIYMSLERRMHCGLGVCQHCGVGQYYTCKHGPVFQYSRIKNVQGAI